MKIETFVNELHRRIKVARHNETIKRSSRIKELNTRKRDTAIDIAEQILLGNGGFTPNTTAYETAKSDMETVMNAIDESVALQAEAMVSPEIARLIDRQ